MKRIIRTGGLLAIVLALAACGGSTGTNTGTTEEDGRLITGTLDAEASAMLVKAAEAIDACIGDVCALVATSADGTEAQGELTPAENRFRVRVRAGNWMFGFEDGAGNRLGTLALNGITALAVEDGDDLELGQVRLRDGQAAVDDDVEDLGSKGLYSYYAQDMDRDGLPAAFDADDPALAADAFDVLFVRPFDSQLHVAPCRPIKVVFTQAIDDATATADAIRVALGDGSAVEGTISVWEDAEYHEYEVTFTAASGYPMGEVISITVVSGAEGVLSEAGDPLPADIVTSFTTRDWGAASTTCHDPDLERQQIRTQERERAQEGDGEGGNGRG